MELVQGIIKSLEIDSSIFPQFILGIVFFLAFKFLFLNKLQFIIENRLNNTLNLEKQADEKSKEAERLSQEFLGQINQAYEKAQEIKHSAKALAKSEAQSYLSSRVEQTQREVEEKRGFFIKEIEQKKGQILSQSDQLSKELLNRLTQ